MQRDWLDQLTRLQDDLPAFDHAKALATIQSELGAPAEQLFATFPDHPVAAASLGQVYKAKLLDGRWVAVKVQRPDLEPRLRLDLAVIRLLAQLSGPFLPLNLGDDLTAIVDEFGQRCFAKSTTSSKPITPNASPSCLKTTPPWWCRRWSGCSAAAAC